MNYAEIASALPSHAVTSIEGLPFPRIASGKVRDIFDLGDALLLVATDRLSAFDVVLPDGIPGKGAILTHISNWWFAQTTGIIQNHLLPDQAAEFSRRGITNRDLQLRSMVVRKLKTVPIECVVRGYLAGSGWKEYQKTGKVCGVPLPPGLRESDRLPEPGWTVPVYYGERLATTTMVEIMGRPVARLELSVRPLTLDQSAVPVRQSENAITPSTPGPEARRPRRSRRAQRAARAAGAGAGVGGVAGRRVGAGGVSFSAVGGAVSVSGRR